MIVHRIENINVNWGTYEHVLFPIKDEQKSNEVMKWHLWDRLKPIQYHTCRHQRGLYPSSGGTAEYSSLTYTIEHEHASCHNQQARSNENLGSES